MSFTQSRVMIVPVASRDAANRMVFKKFGMTVATLEGSVRRKGR